MENIVMRARGLDLHKSKVVKCKPLPHTKARWGHLTESVVETIYQIGSILKLVPFEVSGKGKRKNFKKFSKSWQMWIYYILTGYILARNIFVIHSSIKMYTTLGTVTLFVAGRLLFCVAIMHASVMKLVLLFCTDEMILALNHVEESRAASYIHQDFDDPGDESLEESGAGIAEEEKKSWYYSPDGILGTIVLLHNAGGAEFCLITFSLLEIFMSKVTYAIPIPWPLRFAMDVHHSFSTILMNTTNLCVLMALVLSAKNWLKEFEETIVNMGNVKQDQLKCGSLAVNRKTERSMEKIVGWERVLASYRRLQVFNVYSQGCTRTHFFPWLVALMYVAILIFGYLALTSYSTLPLLIYLFFPVVTFFLLGIVVMAGMSQIANIFRQSDKVCMKIRGQIAQDFPGGYRGYWRGSIIIYSPPQAEALYLKKYLKTIRSFGFIMGTFGAVTLDTPAEMVNNIFNLLLMMLS